MLADTGRAAAPPNSGQLPVVSPVIDFWRGV